ncbi:hypothetical protein Pla163_25040 [Planctomycetes bacterium Pla163]|uniref:Transcription termination factor Rho n=1 Tax=Rohdeia mirabilis TaxID=2528008 RepID=A0A518D1L6_9BACT|nr:hypothetical protein Pla163_25040 [Planctomycetes bacterium Pla163]
MEADRPNSQSGTDTAPFGAIAPSSKSSTRRRSQGAAGASDAPAPAASGGGDSDPSSKDWRKPAKRRGGGRRGGRRRRRPGDDEGDGPEESGDSASSGAAPKGSGSNGQAPKGSKSKVSDDRSELGESARSEGDDGWTGPRSRRRRRRSQGGGGDGGAPATDGAERGASRDGDAERGQNDGGGYQKTGRRGGKGQYKNAGPKKAHVQGQGQKGSFKQGAPPKKAFVPKGQGGGKQREVDTRGGELEGILITDKGGHGKLRIAERHWLADRTNDVHVGPKWITKHDLREGMLIKCRYGKGMGKHKWDITELLEVDGEEPAKRRKVPEFKKLTSIDPDFQYEVGDLTNDTTMRVIDLICPVGRGQRGLIVAPPRSGKTVLMKTFAKAIEDHYPDVRLMVLLVDERPEEATDWKRSVKGDVFVSTNDEMPRDHVDIAEVVWKRAMRLVELGEDVIVVLDSLTRLARAYNHVKGDSGKTMSGGLDAKAMERPKQFFGAARNTETAGSLTILGTALIETGSRMDQVIFEEFKGTGNMELVLSRKLADRRIFPAIDVERSGTRKEEKLFSSTRLRRVQTLRRVLARMHFAEAMDLLTTKLDDVERNDDFLKRFDVDPEA